MPVGWLDHKALMIIKGVGKTPGDSLSAENDPVIVNLMQKDGPITLANDGFSPQIAQIKNGGIWADSPINDGRQLLASPFGNVIEKITINIASGTYLATMRELINLAKMSQDCADYWQGIAQIDPVYLMWHASCGAGPQYALLSSIQLAATYLSADKAAIRVDMSIEREPFWRGLPPGANPKQWTYYVNTARPQWNFNNASLISGSDHLINQTIANKAEWTPAAYGLQSTFLSQNFIDIPSALVPGDAPALVEMALAVNITPVASLFVGLSSKPQQVRGHDNVLRTNSLRLNVGDSFAGSATKTAVAANIGVLSNNSAVTYYVGKRTSTGVDGNWVNYCTWGTSIANGIKLDRQFFRGSFAVFCRGSNQSVVPVLGDMRMRLVITENEDNANQYSHVLTTPEVRPPAAILGFDLLFYLGSITFPLATQSVQSMLGYGVQYQESNSNMTIAIEQRVDVATANRIFEVCDLVFIPIDEGALQIAATTTTYTNNPAVAILDNTGYLSRGAIKQSAVSYRTNTISGGITQEVRGQDLMLHPRTDQRLYFIFDSYDGSGNKLVASNNSLAISLNIIPRWSGIRDV